MEILPHHANDGCNCCNETCIPESDERMYGYNRSNIFQDYTVTQYTGYPKFWIIPIRATKTQAIENLLVELIIC